LYQRKKLKKQIEDRQLIPKPVEKVMDEPASGKNEGVGSFSEGGWYELQGAGS
jgi:hypothetical protein